MSRSTPVVQGSSLYDPGGQGHILLDTPAWLAWLTAPTTTRFSYPLFDPKRGYIVGFMTVRKEHRRRGGKISGDGYWSVYRRSGHTMRRVYLGPATAMTLARLQEIAADFLHEFFAAHA